MSDTVAPSLICWYFLPSSNLRTPKINYFSTSSHAECQCYLLSMLVLYPPRSNTYLLTSDLITVYLLTQFVVCRFGRRWPLLIFHTTASVVLLINIFIPVETGSILLYGEADTSVHRRLVVVMNSGALCSHLVCPAVLMSIPCQFIFFIVFFLFSMIC